jgi:hypothetical protein
MAKGFDQNKLDAIYGTLGSLLRVASDEVPKAIKETLKDIQRDVIANAPLRSGNLKKSVHTKIETYGGKAYVDTRRNGKNQSNFEYGRIVEHGRAGRYKTTNYFYKPVQARLDSMFVEIRRLLKEAYINKR